MDTSGAQLAENQANLAGTDREASVGNIESQGINGLGTGTSGAQKRKSSPESKERNTKKPSISAEVEDTGESSAEDVLNNAAINDPAEVPSADGSPAVSAGFPFVDGNNMEHSNDVKPDDSQGDETSSEGSSDTRITSWQGELAQRMEEIRSPLEVVVEESGEDDPG